MKSIPGKSQLGVKKRTSNIHAKGDKDMDEMFIKKVRSAAVAGWWTLLIFYCVLLVQWFAYLTIMAKQPSGILCLMGEGVTWAEIRSVWLWGIVAFKLVIGTMLVVTVWLTFWARNLAKKTELIPLKSSFSDFVL